jgi:peroxiredoxin
MVTALSTSLCTGSQKDFQVSARKHDGTHIPTIGNQSRQSRQFSLSQEQSVADFR